MTFRGSAIRPTEEVNRPRRCPGRQAKLGAAYTEATGQGLQPSLGHEEGLRDHLGLEPQGYALTTHGGSQTDRVIRSSGVVECNSTEDGKSYAYARTATGGQGHHKRF